jgi:hypothetical protein
MALRYVIRSRDGDDEDRDEGQRAAGRLPGVGRVQRVARRAGESGFEAVRPVGGGPVPYLLRVVRECGAVLLVEGHERGQCLAVLGRPGRPDLTGREGRELLDVGRDLGLVLGRQPALPYVDDDAEGDLAVGEPVGESGDIGGLGPSGQLDGQLVLRDLRELSGEGHGRDDDDQPGDQRQPLALPPSWQFQEPVGPAVRS